jgi:hypothetical protein
MGASQSWIAVKGKAPDVVLQSLELSRSGASADYGSTREGCLRLPGGWFLVLLEGCDHELLESPRLAALSEGAELVAVSLEEHVMVCWSAGWRDGAQTWRVENSEEHEHLGVSGTPPAALAQIRARNDQLAREDAEVDYNFETPLQLAQSIAGFKHDDAGDDLPPLEQLVSTRPKKKPLWKFW